MAVFIDLWPCLLTTKISYAQLCEVTLMYSNVSWVLAFELADSTYLLQNICLGKKDLQTLRNAYVHF